MANSYFMQLLEFEKARYIRTLNLNRIGSEAGSPLPSAHTTVRTRGRTRRFKCTAAKTEVDWTNEGVTQALVLVTLQQIDVGAVVGHEPIYLNGECRGFIEQGAYSLAGTDTGGIGLGYLQLESSAPFGSILGGLCEVGIGGVRVEAIYDSVVPVFHSANEN